MNPITILRRAFASPGATKLSEGEQAQYTAAGISEPAIQRYLAWRRALIFMVVVATVLSAGLTTYRNLTETDDEPALMDSLSDQLMAKANALMPALAGKQKELQDQLKAHGLPSTPEEAAEKAQEAKEKLDEASEKAADAAEKLKAAAAKAKGGDKEDDEKEDAKEKDKESAAEKEPQTAFAKFTDIVEQAPLYVLAVTALLSLILGNRLKLSFRLLAAGFLFGFLLPMVLGLCPWSWWGYKEETFSMTKEPVKYLQNMAEGLMEGAQYLVMLLPTVLSLVPGVLKGCLKVKNLLPQSLLPGWFIVMAAPLYGLFLLVIFIAVDQITTEPLVLGAMGLLVIAHFLYAFRAEAFTAPLLTEADHKRLKGALLMVTAVTGVAGILLLVFITTRQILGVHVFGTDPKKSLMQPLDLVGYALEFVARSMFVTALSVDLFMRMNLSAWRHIRSLATTPDGGMEYQRAMDALEVAGAK